MQSTPKSTPTNREDRQNEYNSTFIKHQIDKVLAPQNSNFNTWPYECIRSNNLGNNILDNPADRYCNMHFYILQSNYPYKVQCNHSYMSRNMTQNMTQNNYKHSQNCNRFHFVIHEPAKGTATGSRQWHRGWGGRLLPHF